jgi:hypothetical protein
MFICFDSIGLPLLLTLFFPGLGGTPIRSSAPAIFGRVATVSRCGISHIGDMESWFCFWFCSHIRLSSGLAVVPEVGLVYDPSAELPRWGEETP